MKLLSNAEKMEKRKKPIHIIVVRIYENRIWKNKMHVLMVLKTLLLEQHFSQVSVMAIRKIITHM